MLSVSDVRTLIMERPGVSLNDLSIHFKVSPGLMEMLVEKLIERGDVETTVPVSCCGGECGGSCSTGNEPKHYKLTLAAVRRMRKA